MLAHPDLSREMSPVLSGLNPHHIGLSWVVAGLGRASRWDHWLMVLAGTLPDLDGVGIL